MFDDSLTQEITSILLAVDVEPVGVQDDVSRKALNAAIGGGWRALYAAAFGQSFVDILAPHHIEAIEWHWFSRFGFINGGKPDYWAYFPIWSRGHLKSTIARRIAVADGLISVWANIPAYILYVSRNKEMVLKHSKSIETLIASKEVKILCPNLSKAKQSEAGASKGYSGALLNTAANVIFHFAGLDEGLAGGNVDDIRPTIIILDDIDGREKSEVISKSRFEKLTLEVLPMRQANTLVFFAQNLINRYSVMYRIQTGHERVLTGRKPTQPIPALINPVFGEKTVGGITKDYVVSGTPTWRFYDVERCNEEIDTGGGLEAFKRECQHDVSQSTENLVHKRWNDQIHAISYSQFASVYGSSDAWKDWYKVAFSDWARTKTKYHANVAGYAAVSSQNTARAGLTFIIPFSFPKDTSPEDVAVRLLSSLTPYAYDEKTWSSLVDDAWKRNNATQHFESVSDRLAFLTGYYQSLIAKHARRVLQMYNVRAGVNSHSEDKVRDMFNNGFGFPFVPANPAAHDSLEDIDDAMRVDFNMPHLFKYGENGYTRFYCLCPDDRSQLPVIVNGVEVYPPLPYPHNSLDGEELHDSDLFRFQMSNRRRADPKLLEAGEEIEKLVKLYDDYGQSLQMIYLKKLLSNIPFTKDEKTELSLSEKVQQKNIDEMPESVEKDMTLQRRKFELDNLNKQQKTKQKGFHTAKYSRR
jgi:hypothetical protein